MPRYFITLPIYLSPFLLFFVLMETSANNAYPPDGDSIGIPFFGYLIMYYPLTVYFASKIQVTNLSKPDIFLWNSKKAILSFFSLLLSIFPLGALWLVFALIAYRSNSYTSFFVSTYMIISIFAVRTYAIQNKIAEQDSPVNQRPAAPASDD